MDKGLNKDFLDIESFAKLAERSVSTLRRHIKKMSDNDKAIYIQRVPMVIGGGDKILISKDYLNLFIKEHSGPEYNTNQEQTKTPEYDTSIIEILRGQIEYLQKQGEVKDGQILNLSEVNKELLERLKEVNYSLATVQKQLSTPIEQNTPKWWQFWK
jgi:hypothetical protein